MIRLFVLLPLLAAVALLLFSLDADPLVRRDASISAASIAQARLLFSRNDPRGLRPGAQRTAQVPVALIDEAFNHFATRTLRGRGAFVLVDQAADFRLSVPVPAVSGRYLNLRVAFRERGGQLHLASAALGSLPIPPAVAEWLLVSAIDLGGAGEQWQLARQVFRHLAFDPARGVVAVSYVWDPALSDRARSLAFTAAASSHAEAAQRTLAGLLAKYPANAKVPLSEILAPLLAAPSGERLQRRRAALLVLAAYVSEKNLAALLPQARQWPHPQQLRLTLLGRYDSAQHFGVSAALAAWAGEPAANAIGVYKEIDDSRHGSGFSFADLAADRAGTRFGELVVADSPRLEQALRGPLRDADLVPALAGLPEYLPEAEFRRRYGNADNAAYRRLSTDIEDRLAALPLYR